MGRGAPQRQVGSTRSAVGAPRFQRENHVNFKTPSWDEVKAAAGTETGTALHFMLRDRLDRETDIIIQRTAWVVGSQAFLFTAYAVSLAAPARATTPAISAKSHLLLILIPWVSLISLALLLVTIGAGIIAWINLRTHAHRANATLHSMEGGPAVRLAGLAAPLFVPVAFLVTWLALLVKG
jgi:hypothetical protein